MEHTVHQAEAEKDISSETTVATKNAFGLMQIPVELRNDIYSYASPVLEELVIPDDFKGSAFDYVRQLLDPALCLNQQIKDEAAMELLHRTMLNAKKIVVPNPKTLCLQLPPNMVFKQVQHVEFTRPQGGSPDLSSPPTAPFGIHDALARCPNVQTLKIDVTVGMLLNEQRGPPRGSHLKTMKEIEELMKFDRILDFKHLHTIQITCSDSSRIAHINSYDSTVFDDFANWMWQKFVDRRRKISFNVKICPGPDEMYWTEVCQRVWATQGHVTFYYQVDFFG